jgi:L-aspartate oxidase
MSNIRNTMWHYVGLIRTERRMERATRELRHQFHEIESFYREARPNDALIGLRNAIQAARIITRAALRNRVSRGAHYRDDG